MIPFRSSNPHHANESPSLTMERGAYRMKAPYSSKPMRSLVFSDQRVKRHWYNRIPTSAMLIALLTFASISSFAMAYYLLCVRWETRGLGQQPVADYFQAVSLDLHQDDYPCDPDETFLSYLPHSGFHNQRIAFENALVLSRLMNRTLLVPPIYLGSKPLHYAPFDALYQELILSSKVGLLHCSGISSAVPLPLECIDYFDQTHLPWDWLVDLDLVKQNQRLRQRWNLSEIWTDKCLNYSESNTLIIKDRSPYQYRFLDTRSDISPLNHRFLENIYISDLVASRKRLVHVGTLFGSSRLRLKDPSNLTIRSYIRGSMSFNNPLLLDIANSIAASLGPLFIGVHLRLGDGNFRKNAEKHTRKAWWQVICDILSYSEEEAFALENDFMDQFQDRNVHDPRPRRFGASSNVLRCQYPLHTNTSHLRLNTPIFISTDVDQNNTVLIGFRKTFPCLFFLADFPIATAPLEEIRNPHDGIRMKHILLPFVDALVVGNAWKVVGTSNSTFSNFIQDVLWRKQHDLQIVQRG
ncbi:hypothetical protein C0993_006712 [Termitomyces sp. T159_Od127]|nr:hypothetical protein C0993_006712 [Termitomyces sp. T159_Od127]